MMNNKIIVWDEIKYFTAEEFKCPCCSENYIRRELILKLDLAREIAGVPFIITSGYRCAKHNKDIGGSKTSSHLKGLAADIAVQNNIVRLKVLKGLIIAGFRRIGIGKDFIHCDIDNNKQNNLWLYPVKKEK